MLHRYLFLLEHTFLFPHRVVNRTSSQLLPKPILMTQLLISSSFTRTRIIQGSLSHNYHCLPSRPQLRSGMHLRKCVSRPGFCNAPSNPKIVRLLVVVYGKNRHVSEPKSPPPLCRLQLAMISSLIMINSPVPYSNCLPPRVVNPKKSIRRKIPI